MGGTNVPFSDLFEGMAYNGEGVNEDGVPTYPRLSSKGASIPFYQFSRWCDEFKNKFTYEDFLDEANSFDAIAFIQHMCSYRK
eukprot:5322153-Karenia_brevis.AAC.1